MKKFCSILYSTFIFLLVITFLNVSCNKIRGNNISNNMNFNKFFCSNAQYTYNSSDRSSIGGKKVFLTFDDGPSVNNTRKIIKILNENNVKATFFVVGIKGEENPEILKELSDNGMSIGIHTYSHDYKTVYGNLESYFNDYEVCKKSIRGITGRDPIPYVRMPGGSDNLVSNRESLEGIKSELKNRGIKYVDWNVTSGDADSHEVPVDKVKNNVINQCQNSNLAIVLMHDTYYKHFTVEALPEIIGSLKNQGFTFRTFDKLTPEEEEEMIRIRVINK